MTFPNIKDYGLSAQELEAKYWRKEHHPDYLQSAWVRAVNLDATLLGYWEFVVDELLKEQEELDEDSPYN